MKKNTHSIHNTGEATLTLPGQAPHKFNIYKGTIGPQAIDISSLYKSTGHFTYDPGFLSTASCESAITYIDGEKGDLLYRGYAIKDLANNCRFLEVAYLLLFGELPTDQQNQEFSETISNHTLLHEQILNFFRGFRRDAHPMAIMVGVVGALSAFYHDSLDMSNPEHRLRSCYRLIAKIPTISAMAYKYHMGQPFVYPRNDLDYSSNFINMMFSLPTRDYSINPITAKALDQIFILHADHEQNASTSTVRLAGSTGANPFACISAGISALWGPSHGGANEAVLHMLDKVGTKDQIPEFLEKIKNKEERLMGFGHRVYKNHDPRAEVLRERAHEVLNDLGINDPLLEVAMEMERIALEDDYFVERKLYPNVDFYSGIILRAMGVPTSMFTVFFCLARTTGWVAQWLEMIDDPTMRIGRPRQIYTGPASRSFVRMDDR